MTIFIFESFFKETVFVNTKDYFLLFLNDSFHHFLTVFSIMKFSIQQMKPFSKIILFKMRF